MVRLPRYGWSKKPGESLAKWLNQPDLNPKFIEDFLQNAEVVFRWIAEYPSLHQLNVAKKKKKLPLGFWDSYQKINDTLAEFTYAPQIDLHELPDGERVSWDSACRG
jgi:hypothetical protein